MVHIRGHFKALRRGEAMANQLLQGLLQLRIARIPKRCRKADDGGLRNADIFAELGGRHKHDFVIMRYNAFGNAPVAFRKLLAAVVEALDQFLRVFQGQYPPLHAFP